MRPKTLSTFLAGFNHRSVAEKQFVLDRTNEPMAVRLSPEPTNPHDEYAVRVLPADDFEDVEILGYLAKARTINPSEVMAAELELCTSYEAFMMPTHDGDNPKAPTIVVTFHYDESDESGASDNPA